MPDLERIDEGRWQSGSIFLSHGATPMSLVNRFFRKRKNRKFDRKRPVHVESLETRRLLAGDLVVVGDSNQDGLFDSSDFVAVFQSGKFESGEIATHAEGDWNGDGYFDSSDFVKAFQVGHYEQAVILAADVPDVDVPDVEIADVDGEIVGDGGDVIDEDDGDADDDHGHRGNRRNFLRHFGSHRILDRLAEGIESGDLPGDLTVEDAQEIIDGINAAIEAGDREAVRALIDQVRAEQKHDAVQAKIDAIQADLDAAIEAGEETLYGLPRAEVETALAAANEAVAADDLNAAHEALDAVRDAQRDAHRAERRLQSTVRKVEQVQAALDAATAAGEETLYGLPIADVEAALMAANEALAAGDAAGATAAIAPIREAKRAADRAERQTRAVSRRIAGLQTALDAAVEAGRDNFRGVAIADVQSVIDSANEAVAAGDLDAANAALNSIREAQQQVRNVERVQSAIDAAQARITAAEEAGQETVGELSIDEAKAAVLAATEALAAGDLDAAKEALSGLTSREGHGGGRHGGEHGGGRRNPHGRRGG